MGSSVLTLAVRRFKLDKITFVVTKPKIQFATCGRSTRSQPFTSAKIQFVPVLCIVKSQRLVGFLTFRLRLGSLGLRSDRTAFSAPSQEATLRSQHFVKVLCAGIVSKHCRAWPALLSKFKLLLCL